MIFLWRGMGIIDFFMREEGRKTVEIRQTMQAKHGNSQVFFEFLFLFFFCPLFKRLSEFFILISESICSLTTVACKNKANKHLLQTCQLFYGNRNH